MILGIQVKEKERKKWQTFIDKWNKRNEKIEKKRKNT